VMDCEFGSGRLCASPLEGRSCLADWDNRTDQLVLRSSTQVPHVLRGSLARMLGLPENAVRVIAPDVGGGFGQKCAISREEVIVAALAQRLRRPVKWTQDRRENLIADHHGHEQQYQVRAAFSSEGNLLGVKADILCDVGAYSSYPFSCGIEPMMAAKDMPGVYKLPHYAARSRAVVTNKAPMTAYRGVSRPQIVLVMERLMDKAARRLGLDRLEIRRRNLIRREDFPYTGITGLVYEEGSYLECLEACAKTLQYDSWPERQAALSTEEWSWGLGLSCFSEYAAYGTTAFSQRKMTMTPGYDLATVEMDPTGAVTVAVGTVSQGQGHATTLAQIAADELGVPVERIRVRQGDTDVVPFGWGTFASRVAVTSGGAVQRAAAKLALQLKEIAAELLEVAPEDIVVHEGRLSVAGSSSVSVPIEELARTAYYFSHKLPSGMDAGLSARASFDPYGTFSNATHGAIVKVHLATGEVLIDRYVVAEDCGVMINPMIVEGQVRGGVTQGVAAALYEQVVYGDDGQPLTGSFMDYLLATINEAPPIEIVHLETPYPGSATGAKGMGEGGVIGAPAAIVNAVDDALMRLGIEFDSIPITPQRIVQSLQALSGKV